MAPPTLDTSRERAARAADRSRIADIDTQILELERTLSSLKDEKDSLRHLHLSSLHVAERNRVRNFHSFPPNLSPVPSANRSSISLPSVPDMPKMEGYSVLYPSAVERHLIVVPQGRESSIETPLGTSPHQKYLAELNHTLVNHFHRIEYLDLSYWPAFEFPTGVEFSLPRLRGLKPGYSLEELTTPLVAPLLQHVVLRTFDALPSSIFPWFQLTVITVLWMKRDEYSYLMNQRVNVVHGRLRIYPTGNLNLGDIMLSHLETFILENCMYFGNDPTPSGIIATLTLPALRRFQIADILFATEDDPVGSITALVTRSGCDLRELCISDAQTAHVTAYHDAFPSTSFVFSSLDITEPFLIDWEDELEDPESSESDEKSEVGKTEHMRIMSQAGAYATAAGSKLGI
ncbi:hypothetical protein DFH08DRAFT_815953 [Mycena albidolilacea]|uniref:Uncharacterized protein n=1 Tax=Mycena albidolilacea TaxID=1033008 RepID=A0AAD6ZMU4_9AGAR|nr:hypothetical protein DFH08DRAFT_815953 [Mycena albidolilacea]